MIDQVRPRCHLWPQPPLAQSSFLQTFPKAIPSVRDGAFSTSLSQALPPENQRHLGTENCGAG